MRRLGSQVRRHQNFLATLGVAAAFGLLVSIPIGGWGGESASAAYYYYNPGGSPGVLTLSPATATNPIGTTHTVTATLTQDGNPIQSASIRFTVTGSVTTTGSCVTGNDGKCSFSYTGPQFPGADTISAFADTNGSGTRDSDEPSATASKTWVLPASTAGSASGNGKIVVHGDAITFDFSAKSSGTTFSGSCTVTDHDTKRKISCRDVTAFFENGKQASFYGHALDNGTATMYVISIVDNGEPGSADSFSITTASGYSASGTLASGNVQVR